MNTTIENGISIEWEQAKQIDITVDGETQTIWTTDDKVKEVLAEANIEVTEHDAVTPAARCRGRTR